jgi:Pro-kumamolisin, activation domain/Putative Ig domain
MRSRHVRLLPCALAAMLAVAAAPASGRVVRLGRAPSLPAGARAVGGLADQTRLHLEVALAPRDPAALDTYAREVSTPGSPLFRRYLTVAQFAQRFGPTSQQIDQVRTSLRAHGLAPGPVSRNGLVIRVAPTAAQARRAFGIRFERYRLGGGQTAYANTGAPALDPTVARLTQAIIGLNTTAQPKPLGPERPSVATGGPQPCPSASSAGVDTADQLASAYRFSSLYGQGDLGAGQTVALYELENYATSDITQYQSCYGTSATVTGVPVDGGATDVPSGEAELDIEDVIGLAPRATVLVYTGPNSGAGPYDTFAQIIGDDVAQVVSTSWGLCETNTGADYAGAENVLFEEAATQGQSVFAATGDNGAEACTDQNGDPVGGPAVSDPAAQPFVTAVGGTHIATLGPPPSETVWNNSHGATGGGMSEFWPMPSYQSAASAALGVIGPDSSGSPCASAFCREVPDVSADADPTTGYAVYFQGWKGIGGTSASAPLWAAFLALANGSSACAGPPVGFANPGLYRAAGTALAADFNDVTSGDNDLTGAGGFAARAGFDMATGLGTPDGAGLAGWLCYRDVVTAPGDQSTLAGQSASVRVTAASSTGSAVSLTASGLPAGLTFDPSTGVISGTPMHPGTSTVTVSARDAAGATGSTSLHWTVRAATVTLGQFHNQSGMVGKRVSLKLSASVDNGRAPSYGAHGLPGGLSIDPVTGKIVGVPRKAGRFRVTLSATDPTGATARGTIRWTVGHAVRVTRASLRGVARARPVLAVAVSAPRRAAIIRTISISLPKGLSLVRGRPGIRLRVPHGARFSASVRRGSLTVAVSRALNTVSLVVSAPALRASAAFARRSRQPPLRITVEDSKRLPTRLTTAVKPR